MNSPVDLSRISPPPANEAAQPANGDASLQQGYGAQREWLGTIDIDLAHKGDKTHIRHLRHLGPLRVQRPFHPEPAYPGASDCCHIYLLHPPGGLVSGDRISINATVAPGAHGLITTPSAGKLYCGDSCGVAQQQSVSLRVQRDGILEWLPQETILFDGALGQTRLDVELDEAATFIGWELFCLGRPAGALPFNSGWFSQQLNITRAGQPLLLEKQQLIAGSAMAHARWGFNGQPVSGTLMAVGFDECPKQLIRDIRAQIEVAASDQFAVTWRLGVLIARYLGDSTERARQYFTRLWQLLRPVLMGKEAELPRIWMT